MKRTTLKAAMTCAAALSLSWAAPVLAFDHPEAGAYEEKLGEAKSMMMADSSKALESAREAANLVVGEDQEAKVARITAKWLEGEALMRLNRGPEAQAIVEAATDEIAEVAPGSKLHADLLRSQASLKAQGGDYGQALSLFLEAHSMYETLGEARSRAIVLQNIGSLYSDARDYERVLDYYRQARESFPEDAALSLSAHNNTGNALKELGRFEEAEQEFRDALEIAKGMGSALLEARILTNIASTQFRNGDLADADATLSRGLKIARDQAPEWLPFLYGVRAQIAYKRGDIGRAQAYVERTFRGQDLAATNAYFRDFHETAQQVYNERGDYRLGSQHLAAFYRIEGQARELSATANNALLSARFDAENRELRISKLSAEKQASSANLAKAQSKVVLLTVAFALVIAGFLVALYALRAVNRSKAAISVANEKLTWVTQHDSLTNLFAREHFRALLDEEVARTTKSGDSGVLMLIDLDRFKQVNDVYGHPAGDQVLRGVAERFREIIGDKGVIGRLGGDEFGVMFPAPFGLDEARKLAVRLIARMEDAFELDHHEALIGASVGMAEIGDAETSTSALMTNADLALYAAKDQGRGTHVVYKRNMRAALEDRRSLEDDLALALRNDQLSIEYQPIVTGDDRRVVCYEALMRWNHPERGSIPPDVFIPIAEDALLIEQLGAWLLRTACKDAMTWDDDVKLTVNVSTLQLLTGAFLGTVVDALASSGLQPNRLLLELTETIVLEMDDTLEALLKSLNELGVSFALDDFGRGYSSLNYIEKMQFSMIKIDRDFVQAAAAGSRKSMAIVAAIVSLAQSLKIDVTAEGIEDEDQVAAMFELGCSCFQGFLFGTPAALTAVHETLVHGENALIDLDIGKTGAGEAGGLEAEDENEGGRDRRVA